MLKKDKNGSAEWLSKLPQMAKQLEVSLYRNARSFEAYTDMSTLKQRLQQIAVEVSRKARDQRDDRHRDRQSSSNSSSANFLGAGSSSHQSMQSSRGQIGNSDDINPMVNNNSTGMSANMRGNMNSRMGMMASSGFPDQRSVNNERSGSNRGVSNQQSNGMVSSGSSSSNRNDPEWRVRIRHKQQRLLLLHHSAKCPHEDGRCSVTPHCADMKRLWKHMEGCKDNQCRVSHCFSSRAILSHYRKCKDAACPACGPVRETVRRTQSRNSSSSNMASNQNRPMMNSLDGSNRMMPNTGGSSQNVDSTHGNPFSSSNIGNSFSQPQSSKPSMPPPPNGSASQYSTMQSSSQQQFRPSGMNNGPTGVQAQQPYQQSSRDNNLIIGGNDTSISGQRSSSGGRENNTSNNQGSSTASSTVSSTRRNDSEWQKVRHKQQRLLLLRHASRCQFKTDCPVTPHCASMKKLWEHIAHCKNQQCTVPHCMSSRYVLSHYRRCQDPRCPACAPVRETIKKSHEKERQGQPASAVNSFDLDKQPNSSSSSFDPTPIGHLESDTSPDYLRSAKRPKTDHGGLSSSMTPQIGSLAQVEPGQSQLSGSQPHSLQSGPLSNGNNPTAMSTPSSSLSQKDSTKPTSGASSDSKTSEDRSLLNSFSVDQLTTHLDSLNRASQLPPAKLKQKCLEVLKSLEAHQHGWVFNCPVDPIELGLPDYFEVIKKPMDLGTVHKKLDNGAYHAIDDFHNEVNLTFDNAMAYNEEGTVVYDMAKELKVKFEADYEKLVEQLGEEDRERRQNERACVLCGCEKRLFEPPVFFCNGMNCQSKRIRRNSHFYIGGSSQYFWCNQCYNDLDEKTPVEFIDLTVKKVDLKKKKNDEVHEESWVQCDVCERWIHQICGLFNTRQNKEHHSEYCCPLCLLEKKKKSPSSLPPPKPAGAADLPRTKLSEFLENGVTKRIEAKKRKMAEEKSKTGVSMIARYFLLFAFIVLTLSFSFLAIVEHIFGGRIEAGARRRPRYYTTSHLNGQKARSPREDEAKIRAQAISR
jgi:hypothetical protein